MGKLPDWDRWKVEKKEIFGMAIIYANQYDPGTKIFAAHISRSGHGKSLAAASYPGPFHQWDFDGRFDGIASAIKTLNLDPSKISFERFYARNGYEPFQKALDELDMMRITNQGLPAKTYELASLTNFMRALINSSHKLQKGRMLGNLRMSGPGDFNFEVTGMAQLLDYLAVLPCNIICSAHIIDKYGKPNTGKKGEEFASNEVIGQKLCLRDQPGEVILSFFSNVFLFTKEVIDDKASYYVEFSTDIAKNCFGIPPGKFDITGKLFYPFLQDLIKQIKEGTFKAPKQEINTNLSFLKVPTNAE